MQPILCLYCTQVTAKMNGNQATFPPHGFSHNGSQEICPLSGKKVLVSRTEKIDCENCGQTLRQVMFQGKVFPEGHNFSWTNSETGDRIMGPAAPTAGFYSKVWCNSGIGLSPIYISERILQYDPQSSGSLMFRR